MTSGKVPAKAFAVFAVALMFAVVFVPLISNWTNNEVDADTGRSSITYHYNKPENSTGSESSVTVDYDGVVSAEYNPNYWQSDNGKNNWDSPISAYVLEALNGEQGNVGRIEIELSNKVDGYQFKLPDELSIKVTADHWRNAVKIESLGDNLFKIKDNRTEPVISCKLTIEFSGQFNFEYLFGGWSKTPQPVDGVVDYYPGEIVHQDDNVTNLYAVWLTPSVYYLQKQTLSTVIDPCVGNFRMFGHESDYVKIQNATIDSEYTNIYTVSGETKMGDYLKTGTYRSVEGGNGVFIIQETWNNGRDHDYHIPLIGNVILDNITLKSGTSASNHGSDSDHGLFADGHRLIIGTNVSTISDDSSNPMSYPQIFGGRASNTYKDHTNEVGTTNPSSTDVVIFSGTYYNVVAGNYDVSMSGDTHLVVRGKTTVLDTVVGGNSAKVEGISVSNTWIYILGGCLPADSYQEDQLGTSGNTNGVTLTESTILTGGSNNGRVTGSTNVFISGDADLWDVQGAGRRGMSSVGTANVEVSGQAVIRHVLCGSITDGLDGVNGTPSNMREYDGSVKNVNIKVKDAAAVGSVFGAGYDTYYNTLYASMFNGGSISIDIQGGTVGYVYGGGYRGAIGYSGELSGTSYGSLPLNSISISISGGTVLGDVFGGGRGGVDKVIHSNVDGDLGENDTGSPGKSDSTGFAWVSVKDLSITVSGDAVVKGSVYGGGESAPGLTDHIKRPAVAFMDADSISLEVSGSAQVLGSVFGAGKGVDTSTYTTDTMVLKSNNSTKMDTIPWHSGSDEIDGGYDDKTNYNAAGYAAVGQGRNTPNDRPDIALSIVGEAKVGDGQSAVFGAGRLAYTYAESIEIHLGNGGLSGPELKGDVFGGGLGTSGEFSVESSRTIVLNSATVNGNIYGGSRDGNDGNVSAEVSQISKTAEINLISGTVKQNVFGGGFQGKSMYDAVIRFGTPAVDEVRPTSVQNTDLRVTSIYGGGYFDPDSGTQVQDLVMGDATIHIGSSPLSGGYSFPGYTNIGDAGSGSRISISGNVFGDGSYSTVKGTTTVEFDGYTQTSGTASQRMMSVQLVDVLRFISSEVDLSGSSQGGTGTLSQKMSLNSVGSLNLHASSSIRLYAETSAIGGLNSYESEDESSLFLPEGYDGSKGNSISLLGGALGTILGANNMGTDSKSPGIINGFTELDKGGDVYYGAFILGSRQTYDNTGGFVVKDEEGNYGLASVLNYNQYIKVWFIAGASSIERVLTFSADQNGSYLDSGDVDSVTFPKIAEDSKLYYTGAYIDYESQNSMYVAEEGTSDRGKVVFNMGLYPIDSSGKSVSVSTHTYNGSSWVLQTSSSNSEVNRQIILRSNLDNDWLNDDYTPASYGLLGYVVVQVIEAYSYGTAAGSIQVPIHTIDLIVGMYIEPVDGAGDFNVTLVDTDNGLYTGSVYIPLSWKGVVTDYTFSGFNYSGFSDRDNQFTLSAGTLMGMDGWIQTDYRDGYTVNIGENVSFGSGGVVQPVLVLEYSGPGLANGTDSGTLTFEVELTSEDGGLVGNYEITVTFSTAEPVHVYLQYSQLSDNGKTYVLSSTDEDGRTVLKWDVKTEGSAGYGVELPFNTAITEHTFREGVYIDGKPYDNLEEVLDAIIESIKDTDIEGFVYKEHFAGWFSDPEMIRMYNMGSDVSQDIVLYAKFGIKVTFDYGNNTPAYQTFIGYNTSLHDNGIYNYNELGQNIGGVEVTNDKIPGYAYFHGDSDYVGHYIRGNFWVASTDSDELEPMRFDIELQKDIKLYIAWEVETYNVDIEVEFKVTEGPDGSWFDLSGQADGGSFIWDQSKGVLSFEADYNSIVTFTIASGMHIGRDTTGTYGDDQQLPFIGDSSSTQFLSFRVPDAGNDVSKENPGKIFIRITVTDLFDVTVDLIYEDGFTSKLQPGDSLTATPVNGSGTNLNAVTISSSSLDSTGGATIILQDLPVNTLIDLTTVIHEGAGYGYTMSVWVNGVLVDEDFDLRVSGNNIDPVVTVALHRIVNILNEYDWDDSAHISGISVYKVAVPSSPNGEWGYEYDSTWVSAEEIQSSAGYQMRENDAFVISPIDGYMVIDGYEPSNTKAVVKDDVLYFVVTGVGDVRFGELTIIESHLYVTIVLMDGDGMATGERIATIYDWQVNLVFDSRTYTITAGDTLTKTLDVPYPTVTTGIGYTCSLEGFHTEEGTFPGGSDRMTIVMTPIGYTIHFHHLDGKVEDAGWTVYDSLDDKVPERFETAEDPEVPGQHLYVRTNQDGALLSFITDVSTDMFDVTMSMHISAIAQPVGWVEGTVTEGVTVMITTSVLKDGQADIGKGLFGGMDVEFSFDGKIITYDAETGVLKFNDARIPASGSVTLVSGSHMLTIYVIADAEAIL